MHKEYETYKRWHAVTMTGRDGRTFISALHLARFIHCDPEIFWNTCVLPNFPNYNDYIEPLARDLLLTKDMARLILPLRRKQRGERLDWAFEQGPGTHRYEETHRKTHKPKVAAKKYMVSDGFDGPYNHMIEEAPEGPFATLVDDEEAAAFYCPPDPEPTHVGQMDAEQKLAALIRRVDEVYGEILDLQTLMRNEAERIIKCVRKLMAPDLLDG